MISSEEWKKRIKEVEYLKQLFVKILLKPQTVTNRSFCYTKNRNKYNNKFVYFFIFILFLVYALLKLFIREDGIRGVVINLMTTVVSIISIILPVVEITFDSEIKQEYKKYYFLCFFTVGLAFSGLINVFLFAFVEFENYLFYGICIVIAFCRLFWICCYVPIKCKKDAKIFKFLRIIKVTITFFLTNILLTGCLLSVYTRNDNKDYELTVINDPIFTEVFNETKNVINADKIISELLLNIYNIPKEDFLNNLDTRTIIIQDCNSVKNKLTEYNYDLLHYKTTKRLFDFSNQSMNKIDLIISKTNNIVNEDVSFLEEEIEKFTENINYWEDKVRDIEYEINLIENELNDMGTLKKQIEFEYNSLSEEEKVFREEDFKKRLISVADTVLKSSNEYERKVAEYKEINLKLKNIERQINNIKYKVKKVENNINEYLEIIDIVESLYDELNRHQKQIDRITKYIDIRIKAIYLGL